MRKHLFLFFCLSSFFSSAQTRYQIGMGGGFFLPQKMKMKTGNIGLKFKQDKNVFIDFNKIVNTKYNISLGSQAILNLASYWYEPDKSIQYYSEKPHIPIFQFESVELNFYIKKYFKLSVGENYSNSLFCFLGPSFNINQGNAIKTRHSYRDNSSSQSFQISYINLKAQKPFVPYLRFTGGVELLKKLKKKHYLGISPFFSWAGLQSENNEVTVLKNDPTYISTGNFKRNRSGYGVRLIFSK